MTPTTTKKPGPPRRYTYGTFSVRLAEADISALLGYAETVGATTRGAAIRHLIREHCARISPPDPNS